MINRTDNTGTVIGMNKIKQRRLKELKVSCCSDLYVGQFVPFYFCPRSVMLYLIYKDNHEELTYHGGQEPIIHIEADLYKVVKWAEENNKNWAFSLSNAGARYTEFRNNLQHLNEINWAAVEASDWLNIQELKQAEFLIEEAFPIELIDRIGVYSKELEVQVRVNYERQTPKPAIITKQDWYY